MSLKPYKGDVGAWTKQFQAGGGATTHLTTSPVDIVARAASNLKRHDNIKTGGRAKVSIKVAKFVKRRSKKAPVKRLGTKKTKPKKRKKAVRKLRAKRPPKKNKVAKKRVLKSKEIDYFT